MNTTIDYSWQDQSKCKDKYDLFFPKVGRAPETKLQKICASCPVKQQCLDHALKYEEHGFWGGTNRKSRDRMRKELGIELASIEYESIFKYAAERERIEQAVQAQKIQGRGAKKNSSNTLTELNPFDYYGDNLEEDWSL